MWKKGSFLIEHDVVEANEDKFVILICRLNANKVADEGVDVGSFTNAFGFTFAV